jgi:acylphosphatase
MNTRAFICVSGRVQGVFFREHTRKWATSLGLTGWVRNTEDSQVEITVEGERDTIERLLELLRLGSPLSRVDFLDVNWEVYSGEFQDFRITW